MAPLKKEIFIATWSPPPFCSPGFFVRERGSVLILIARRVPSSLPEWEDGLIVSGKLATKLRTFWRFLFFFLALELIFPRFGETISETLSDPVRLVRGKNKILAHFLAKKKISHPFEGGFFFVSLFSRRCFWIHMRPTTNFPHRLWPPPPPQNLDRPRVSRLRRYGNNVQCVV